MQYQVLVENWNQNGFIASVIGMPDCRAEGATKEEAIAGVREALSKKLATGEIVTIDLDVPIAQSNEHPLMKHFGRFKDDPTFDDLLERIDDYRREFDAEEAAKEAANESTREYTTEPAN